MKSRTEVWAMAFMEMESEQRLRRFLASRPEIVARRIRRLMHVSIYHARRPLRGLFPFEREIDFSIPISETRLMTMTPGGENPRPGADSRMYNIGLRIRRGQVRVPIEMLRSEFYKFETREVLGIRSPSTNAINAFGARAFQPHITILRQGGISAEELSSLGMAMRANLDTIRFDKFVVEVRNQII